MALVDDEEALVDMMLPFFGHREPQLACNAVKVYLRRLYRAYDIHRMSVRGAVDCSDATPRDYLRAFWQFRTMSSYISSVSVPFSSGAPPAKPQRPGVESYEDLQVCVCWFSLGVSYPLPRSVPACLPHTRASAR
jgi:hypothetical protein